MNTRQLLQIVLLFALIYFSIPVFSWLSPVLGFLALPFLYIFNAMRHWSIGDYLVVAIVVGFFIVRHHLKNSELPSQTPQDEHT